MGRSSDRGSIGVVCLTLLVVACGSTGRTEPPTVTVPPTSAAPTVSAIATSRPSATAAAPTVVPTPGLLPIETPVDTIEGGIHLAPTADGGVVVAMPAQSGTALVGLDGDGRVKPGWPALLDGGTDCSMTAMPARDGSFRLSCLGPYGDGPTTAWAVDRFGAVLDGWPVTIEPVGWVAASGIVGDAFVVLTVSADIADDPATGLPLRDIVPVTVASTGQVTRAAAVRTTASDWTIGPEGSVVGTGGVPGTVGDATRSRIVVIERGAVRPGWPVEVDGVASAPTILADGSVLVSVGWHLEPRTRVLAFDREGDALPRRVIDLPLTSLEWQTEASEMPRPPIVAADGTSYAHTGIDGLAVVALDGDGTVLDGWPYRSTAALSRPGYCPLSSELGCAFDPTPPAVGVADIVLSLAMWSQDGHGALVALDRHGAVRDGWPITLRREGAEFWALARSADDVTFAVAVEPEEGDGSSATVLAIEPDSTVRWRTTVAESR